MIYCLKILREVSEMKKNENKGSITKNSSLSWKGYLIATLSFLLLGGILTLLCWYSGGWSTSLWAAQIVCKRQIASTFL